MELATLPRDATDQDFALVCYNCAQTPTLSLNVTPASLEMCAPDDAVYKLDVGSKKITRPLPRGWRRRVDGV